MHVNEINALGVKNITDLNINHKILQSHRKPDYDLVKAIIYEKKLEDLRSSHILSKIMEHELQIMPKSKKAPQEKPPTTILSNCKPCSLKPTREDVE
jgi:hypothetical protein